MLFGITAVNSGPYADPARALMLARVAEDLGYDSLWTVEHVVVPSEFQSRYPYSPDGTMRSGEDDPIPDPLIWMAFVAARTTTIRLATGVLVLPQVQPLRLAKAVATLDVLSGGRMILGVGVGWLREEFDALGVDGWDDRGARTDEYIEALRVLWRENEPSFAGRFCRFERAKSWPKPIQIGGVPIVVGGHANVVARRAGRLGDGFFPAPADPGEVGRLVGVMRVEAESAGRDPDTIEITCGRASSYDHVARLADLGVHRATILAPRGDDAAVTATLERYREQVIDRFAI